MGRIWKKEDENKEKKKKKKAKTCNRNSTCGLLERTSSASSSSIDAGYGGDTLEKPPLPPQTIGKEEAGDSSNTSGIGMSQSDLQMDSGDGLDPPKPVHRTSIQRTSLSEPMSGDGLPILTPIQKPSGPMLTALYEKGCIAPEDPATWHTGLSDTNKPDQNDHRSKEGSPETAGKKKRKKRRSQSKLGLVQRHESVAMETISPRRSAMKYEPAPVLRVSCLMW